MRSVSRRVLSTSSILVLTASALVAPPVMASASATAGQARVTPAQAEQVCGKWDTVDIAGRLFVVQNNVWGADTAQCVDVPDTSQPAFVVTTAEHNNQGGTPAAYPSIFEGCHWEDCTGGSELPIRVDDLDVSTTTWEVTADAAGAWNVAYDVWFKSDPAPGPPDGAELMIWLDSQGGVQPAGSMVAQNVPIAGANWNVWLADIGWNYIAYQRTSPTSSANFDLSQFVDDAVARGAVQPSWYLVTVEAGFELWRGGAGMATTSFSFDGSEGGECVAR